MSARESETPSPATSETLESSLARLRAIAQARQQERAWGEVVVRYKWENGTIKWVVFQEESICRSYETAKKLDGNPGTL